MITEELRVSLAQIRAEMATIQRQAEETDRRSSAAERRVQMMAREIQRQEAETARVVNRIQDKFKDVAKDLARQGIGTAAGLALSAIDIQSEGFEGFLGRAGVAGIQGFLTAGLPGLGVGVGLSAFTQLTSQVQRLLAEQEGIRKELRRRQEEQRQIVDRINEERDRRVQELVDFKASLQVDTELKVKELEYQNWRLTG